MPMGFVCLQHWQRQCLWSCVRSPCTDSGMAWKLQICHSRLEDWQKHLHLSMLIVYTVAFVCKFLKFYNFNLPAAYSMLFDTMSSLNSPPAMFVFRASKDDRSIKAYSWVLSNSILWLVHRIRRCGLAGFLVKLFCISLSTDLVADV